MKLQPTMKHGGTTAATSGVGTAPGQVAAPKIGEWPDVPLLPSALMIGPSGGGKTNVAAQLMAAGFHVCLVPIEDKHASLAKYKPLRVQIPDPVTDAAGKPVRLPTPQEKMGRVRAFTDALRRGEYREHNGKTVDLLFVDGLMELAALIALERKARYSAMSGGGKAKTIVMWDEIARATMDAMWAMRDAAGMASALLGLKPLGVVTTCGIADKKRVVMQGETSTTEIEHDMPLLQGNEAKMQLPFQWEIIWRLDTGYEGGQHVFRVHTVAGEGGAPGKSPAGIFDKMVTGPGGLDDDGKFNAPDCGAMYRRLLEDERSPYWQGGAK